MKVILLCLCMSGTSSFSLSLSCGVGLLNSNSFTGVGSAASDGFLNGRRRLLTGVVVGTIALSCPKTLARLSSRSILSGVLPSGKIPGTSLSIGDVVVLPSNFLSASVGLSVPLLYLSRIISDPHTNRCPFG